MNEILVKLENERLAFNKKAVDTSLILKKLNKINSGIACCDVKDLAAEYNKQQAEYEKAEKVFKAIPHNAVKT